MAARNLIINADDFNSDEDRNRGILEAAEKGIVSSVTVIANLPFTQENVSRLKKVFGRRIGVHLNLTKGTPIAKGTPSLVDESNQFFTKKTAWRRALLHQYNLKEVEKEFAAQISRLQELGITPDHLDGNNHLHVFPGIVEVVARLARDCDIKKIRLPLANRASGVFKSFGLVSPEHFGGIQFPRAGDIESFRKFFRKLLPGTTELMCHPGYRNSSLLPTSGSRHEEELAALAHPEVLDTIKRENINLISYQDL